MQVFQIFLNDFLFSAFYANIFEFYIIFSKIFTFSFI